MTRPEWMPLPQPFQGCPPGHEYLKGFAIWNKFVLASECLKLKEPFSYGISLFFKILGNNLLT